MNANLNLMKSWTKPTDEVIERTCASLKKETDRVYFFSKLRNPLWLPELVKRGFYTSPPAVRILPNGYQLRSWPELTYLRNIAEHTPDAVIDVALGLPRVDNPAIYKVLVDIALALPGEKSARLVPKIIEYAAIKYRMFSNGFQKILKHWVDSGQETAAFDLMKALVPFVSDPDHAAKVKRQEEDPSDWTTDLKPSPRIDGWEYQKILEEGVRPLAEKMPLPVAEFLLNATQWMIRLKGRKRSGGDGEDYSEIWCRRLDVPTEYSHDSDEALAQTLVFATESVFRHAPDAIQQLDDLLRKQSWKLFRRIRQHLYSRFPSEQTLPWIREEILSHPDYAQWDYHFEFQQLIRKSAEHFGKSLLPEDDLERIVGRILSGPSKDEYRSWLGEKFTEEEFARRQRYFHRKQLHPFASILPENVARYFAVIDAEENKPLTDENYAPFSATRSGIVSYRSPVSKEDLGKLSDEALLKYINDWQESRYAEGEDFVEINIDALASAFQWVFNELISPNQDRLAFWIRHRDQIARPVYVKAILQAYHEQIRAKHLQSLDVAFDFCLWTLTHDDGTDDDSKGSDESKERPNWRSSRREVGDIVETCISKDVNLPVEWSGTIAALLKTLCISGDWRLDRDKAVFLNRDDQLAEAINNTRSRAIQTLVNFGFWGRRFESFSEAVAVKDILELRLLPAAPRPLTLPEHAMLGMEFGNLASLDRKWTVVHQARIFPHENLNVWLEAFGAFLRFNHPDKALFDVLRGEFEFALQNLPQLISAQWSSGGFVDVLGQHCLTYFLWELYPLAGNSSLLRRFYELTAAEEKVWAALFNHTGHLLRNTGKGLEPKLVDRLKAYVEWRVNAKSPTELQQFTFWLDAEAIEAEWRLRMYSKALDVMASNDVGISIEVEALSKLRNNYPELVLECLTKLTRSALKNQSVYFDEEHTTPILRLGLASQNEQVRQNAEEARDNLLRAGRFEFLRP